MNSYWIAKSLEYNGLPLKSLWDAERGEAELPELGITSIDYTTYRNRTRNLDFSERRVRHKLHQFIAKNATALFDQNLVESVSSTTSIRLLDHKEELPVVYKAPPYECFLEGQHDLRLNRVINVGAGNSFRVKFQ